ncbi:MAG: S8 family serine peptidase [Geminicoccaceae bacterium]|nr:S8 family serine peptidase [Geminicoccaceae bacterium]
MTINDRPRPPFPSVSLLALCLGLAACSGGGGTAGDGAGAGTVTNPPISTPPTPVPDDPDTTPEPTPSPPPPVSPPSPPPPDPAPSPPPVSPPSPPVSPPSPPPPPVSPPSPPPVSPPSPPVSPPSPPPPPVSPPSPPPVSPPPPDPAPASLPEDYKAGYNTALIGADAAYLKGARGQGVTVAVIDSGIDLTGPEFKGRIASASTDVVTGTRDTLNDESGHGSHVAGIIGAAANGKGTVGVAPEAKILALRADLRDATICEDPGCGYFDTDVALAIDLAIKNKAKVINLSIGKEEEIKGDYRTALKRATAADVLIVSAAGNEDADRPSYPAAFAGNPEFKGLVIAVGGVNRDKRVYANGNRPTDLAQAAYYLVAPAVAIQSTFTGGDYLKLTGTSMASPHVAGAAAALKSAFPNLKMQQVAEILLTTAEDLGDPGTDLVYGRGLVDLDKALQPLGDMTLPSGATVAGGGEDLAGSGLVASRAMGDSLANAEVLGRAMAVDGFDRPYAVDLRPRIRAAARANPMERLLAPEGDPQSLGLTAPEPGGLSFGMDVDRAYPAYAPGSATAALQGGVPDDRVRRVWLGRRLAPGLGLQAGAGVGLEGVGAAAPAGDGLFLDDGDLLRPWTGVLDYGFGVGLTGDVSASTRVGLGLVAATDDGRLQNDARSKGRAAGLTLAHDLGEDVSVNFGFRWLEEAAGLLGGSGTGALALGDGSTRTFETGLGWRLAPGLRLAGQASLGLSDASGGGMVEGVDGLRTGGWSVSLTQENVLAEGDRLGFLVGQPLRVLGGHATLDVPVGRDLEGNVARERVRTSLEPSGRETDLQLAYGRDLGPASALNGWLMLRHEPGHDASAADDVAVGMRFVRRF